jgi:hypothetical protein
MYQLRDVYDKSFNRKEITLPSIHILHQHRDQVTGVETRKSDIRKKKRQLVTRVNRNLRDRKIAALAKVFLKNNKPIQASV